jgi:DNA-binding NarL/FixJ family response regulator
VKKTVKQNALSVCLLSSHSLALSELQRVLKNPAFTLVPKQLDSTSGSELRQLKIPRANVYVVDAHFMLPAASELLSNILDQYPEARIIVVSGKFEPAESYSFLHMGAKGLLTFDDAREQLTRALPLVSKGGYWVPRAVLSGFVESILQGTLNLRMKVDPSTNITNRQQEVLDGLLQQLSNKEVGAKLNISMRTVKFHVSNILSKFGVRRRSDLILLCSQRGTPSPDPMARVPKRNDPKTFSGNHAAS